MDLVKILPKKNKYLVFSILNSKEFKNFALGYKTGTTVLHLNKNCFKDFNIKLPYLDKIEKAINNLKDFPYSGSVPHYATLRRQGYRVLIVERHLVFYKVNESQQIVTIYAVVDGRREYRKLL